MTKTLTDNITPIEALFDEIGISCLGDIYDTARQSEDEDFSKLAQAVDAKLDSLITILPHIERQALVEDATLAVMVERGYMVVKRR